MSTSKPNRGLPRAVDAAIALGGLVLATPILGLSALAIRATSPGPILFRQTRVGRDGTNFRLYKFRTMRVGNTGPGVTAQGDSRITRVGRFLRHSKLDELPELWNVLRGDMSLVGPRPELPQFVDMNDPLWKTCLEVLPGITHPNAIMLRNEEAVLADYQGDRERFYVATLQRFKLFKIAEYERTRTWCTDVKVLLGTALAVVLPNTAKPPSVADIEAYVDQYNAGAA